MPLDFRYLEVIYQDHHKLEGALKAGKNKMAPSESQLEGLILSLNMPIVDSVGYGSYAGGEK